MANGGKHVRKTTRGSAQCRVFNGGWQADSSQLPMQNRAKLWGRCMDILGGLMREGTCLDDGSGRVVRKDRSTNADGDGNGDVGEEMQTYEVIRN